MDGGAVHYTFGLIPIVVDRSAIQRLELKVLKNGSIQKREELDDGAVHCTFGLIPIVVDRSAIQRLELKVLENGSI